MYDGSSRGGRKGGGRRPSVRFIGYDPGEVSAMLVLSRKQSEKLFIGEDICVTVVRLGDGQVRLGIEAPRAVSIVRAELRERDRLTRTPGLRHRVHNAVMTARSETVTAGVS